jgi:hypothetical protein
MKLNKKDQISETIIKKTDDGWVFIVGKDKIDLYHFDGLGFIKDKDKIELYHFFDNFNKNAEAVKRLLDKLKLCEDKLELCEGELDEQKQENKDNK